MPLITDRKHVLDIYAEAEANKWVLPTFNSENLTTCEAILQAVYDFGQVRGIPDLPIIIGIWMIGWTLAQIGNSGEQIEINQKVLQTHRKLDTTETDTETTETEIDDRRITNEPISA